MKRKSLTAMLALLLLLTPVAAFAEDNSANDTITKEYEFTSQTPVYRYDAPENITEGGVLYIRKEIKYELLETIPITETQTQVFTEIRNKDGMAKKDDDIFAKTLSIEKDGFVGEIPRVSVAYTEQKTEGASKAYTTTINYGAQVEKPTPPLTTDRIINNATVKFTFVEMKQSAAYWEPNFIAQLNCGVGDLPSLDDATPAYQGYERTLLELMRLDPHQYVIRGARWVAGKTGTSRLAEFEISRYVIDYTAIYEASIKQPDKISYDAVAKYEGELSKDMQMGSEYRVMAVVTYEPAVKALPTPTQSATPEPSPAPTPPPQQSNFPTVAVVAGGGVIVLAGVLLFLKKRKQQNGE